MKKIRWVIIVFSMITVFACKNRKSALISGNLINFLDQDCDASITIERSVDINGTQVIQENIMSGFVNYSGSAPNVVEINDIILNEDNEFMMQNFSDFSTLYGAELTVKFDTTVVESGFYNAESLKVSYDDSTYGSSLSEGITFIWNPDSLSQGVLIEAMATVITNPLLSSNIIKREVVTDNGIFTIPTGWLSDFPQETIIYFSIIRGNYKMILTPDKRSVQLIGFTNCYGTFIKS